MKNISEQMDKITRNGLRIKLKDDTAKHVSQHVRDKLVGLLFRKISIQTRENIKRPMYFQILNRTID